MKAPIISRRTALRWGLGALAASTGVGMLESELRLTRRTLSLSNWRADGFRVAQVSDIHVNDAANMRTAREAVRVAVAQGPDLFVFTGDFVNYARPECLANIVPAFEALADLACPCVAILGNHEYTSGSLPMVLDAAAKTKLRVLINEAVDVGGVRVVGLDDALNSTPDYGLVSRVASPSTLVLLHEPDYVDQVPSNAGLVLSGHSHGGEICLPGGFPIHTPRGARRYTRGYYPHANVPLYVNRGTATLTPARVFCPPEVAILTLRGHRSD